MLRIEINTEYLADRPDAVDELTKIMTAITRAIRATPHQGGGPVVDSTNQTIGVWYLNITEDA